MGQLIQTKLHDSERTTLQYCVQIGFGPRPVLKQVLCHCWFPFKSISLSDESELQKIRNNGINFTVPFCIRTALVSASRHF